MDGFKSLPKMSCFKTGGSVKVNVMKKGGKAVVEGEKSDLKQDEKTAKKVVKSAFGMHDSQLHDGEKTDLSKLRKGGRAKKEGGNVRKYKKGGSIDVEMKKTSGDMDKIDKVKRTVPEKADAPSEAAKRPFMRASDVEKEKSKPAGEKDKIKKVPPTGNKTADAESKGEAKPVKTGLDAVDDIDGMKKGSSVKKFKAGKSIKKMADGGLTGQPILTPEQRMAISQAMYKPQMPGMQQMQPGMQQMQPGMQQMQPGMQQMQPGMQLNQGMR